MPRHPVLLTALLCAVAVSTARADPPATLVLQGTVRDFNDTHADFEKPFPYVIDTQITTADLGSDGKPVYTKAEGAGGTVDSSGRTAFDQWYRDVPAVNVAAPLDLTLSPLGGTPPRYAYDNNAFFPIDGQLLGNQARAHNFHFTFEAHHSFTYGGGENLKFTGDDDVWVYINGHKVIDLGGVHPAASATVSLDDKAAELGITIGRAYPMDFFFAERHTDSSTFHLETSLLLEEPDIFTVTDRATPEGDTGTTQVPVTVQLARAATKDLTVEYATTTTGSATEGVDFTPVAGSVQLPEGTLSATFDVPVIGDTANEPDETVGIRLGVGAELATGTLTIADDDAPPPPAVATTSAPTSSAPTTAAPTTAAATPTVTPDPLTLTGAQLLLACGELPLAVRDVLDAAKSKVAVTAQALPGRAGRTVEVLYVDTANGKVKSVGTTTAAADGAVRTTLPAPTTDRRKRASYAVRLDGVTSRAVALVRRMTDTKAALRNGGRTIEVKGRIAAPRARRPRPVKVTVQTGCAAQHAVATVTPDHNGRYRASFPASAAPARAAIVRAQTKVPSHRGGPSDYATFTLPQPVDLR